VKRGAAFAMVPLSLVPRLPPSAVAVRLLLVLLARARTRAVRRADGWQSLAADDLALVGNVAHVNAESDGLGGFEDSGLQDLSVLLKYRFLSSGPHSLLAAGGVRTPLSDYEANLPVDLGDGTTDVLARLVYLFNSGAFYFSQQVGYDFRGDDAPDGVPLYTELGFTTGSLTWIGFYSQLTARDGTDIGDPGFTFPSNKDEYSRVGAKIYARLGDRWGFSVLGFTTLDGRNSGDTQGFSLGTNVRF